MALQVWLPLNGNLKNQGLSNVTVTNNGATINDNGKIGKCYNFTISQYLEITNLSFNLLSNCSLCFWLKYDNEERWLPFSGQGQAYYILAEQNYTTNFYHNSIGSNTIKIYVDGTLSTAPPNDGQWHHYCITGADLTSWTKFYINRYTATNNSFNLEGQYNDIRIYDHCLSPKEVKEISKGLVVHYKLDDEYIEGTINYLGVKSEVFSNWSSYGFGSKGIKSIEDTSPAISGEVCKVTSGSTDTGNKNIEMATWCTAPSLEKNGIYTFSAYVKGIGPTIGKQCFLHVYNTNGTDTRSVRVATTTLTEEWKRVSGQYTWTYDNPSSTSFSVYVVGVISPEESFLFCNPQFEMKDHVTPYINRTRNNNITIYDCSGYCNNGTINKNYTLTTNNKSPRYIVGTNVENGFTIRHSNVLNSNNQEWTCCCWIKLNSLTSCYLNNFNVGNKIIHSLSGDQANYSLLYLNSDEHDYYSYSNLGLEENTWYHIAFVFKNSEGLKKIYINGEDHTEIGLNRDSTPLGFQNTITLFQNFNGVASDYREYCTALSSEDILDLYNTSAYIYNNQTLATYQFVEESTTPQSFKTGVFKSNTFLEGELSEDFEHSTNVEIINGETWLKLLHHNNPAVNLFTSSNCWNYNSDNLFSNLDLLRSDNLLNNLSEYEFLVKEKLESSSTEVQIRWKQTNNPATTTTATGYTLIQGNPTHLSPGLVLSGGTHGCIDIYGSDWWCCCGCYTAYQGGIPGFMDVIKSGYLDLYIKINNSVILNKTQTAFYSNKVETNQLIEI